VAPILATETLAEAPSQHGWNMEPGRLICVRKYQGDPATVAYVVALSEPDKAKVLIHDRLGISAEYIDDLGSVSSDLMTFLGLDSGEFIRADDPERGLWKWSLPGT
jgi:hypothetical protein